MQLLVKNRIIYLRKCKVCRGNVCICLDGKSGLEHRDDVQEGGAKTEQNSPNCGSAIEHIFVFLIWDRDILFNLIETGGVSCIPKNHKKR